MRIVGGKWRGRPLASPGEAAGIRPTSDRLRETLFNVLAHAYDDAVVGARVLDLFAGTGALGFEALSRGAAFATFVDDGAASRGLMRETVEALGCGGETRIFRRDATRMGQAAPNPPCSLVFCDPPYGRDLAGPALSSCRAGGWLAPEALVLVEEDREAKFVFPVGFEELERRSWSGTTVAFGRVVTAG